MLWGDFLICYNAVAVWTTQLLFEQRTYQAYKRWLCGSVYLSVPPFSYLTRISMRCPTKRTTALTTEYIRLRKILSSWKNQAGLDIWNTRRSTDTGKPLLVKYDVDLTTGWSTNELTSSARLARILTSKRAAGLINTSRASVLALFVPLFASLVLVKMFVYTL